MTFVWPVRVYYEDTDSGGVVYYANYLKFMERARSEWLRSLGWEQDELIRREGILFAVRALEIEYLRSALFNDLLWVGARVIARGRASLRFEQQIVRKPESADPHDVDPRVFEEMVADKHQLLLTGKVKVACLNASTFKPCALPIHFSAEIVHVI